MTEEKRMTNSDHYTWNDCEPYTCRDHYKPFLETLHEEQSNMPELKENDTIPYKLWCTEFGEKEEKAFQVMSQNVYAALGAYTAYSEKKRNASKSVLVKIKNTENGETHQLFIRHGLK